VTRGGPPESQQAGRHFLGRDVQRGGLRPPTCPTMPAMLRRIGPYWILVVAYAALIFKLSSLPGSSIHLPPVPNIDKLAHLCEYGGFGALLAWAFMQGHGLSRRLAIVGAWVVGTFYGATDEFHQFFLPTRSCELGDLIADSLGSAVGATTGLWLLNRLGLSTSTRLSTEAP
jgi:VanZ family protein